MTWVSPKEQKREQVIKTTVVALFSVFFTIYFLATSHAESPWDLLKYIFLVDGAPAAHGVHPFFITVIALISSVFAYIEYREYRQGRYRIWPEGKDH